MENQHRLIKGYAELGQDRIDLMNEISKKGEELEALLEKAASYVKGQRSAASERHAELRVVNTEEFSSVQEYTDAVESAVAESKRLDYAQPERWLAMSRTELQTGLMFMKRGVAQPALF